MRNIPKISVVLPTFNRAQLIENAIQSVLQQTFTNFELLIIDDGSQDNTEEIVQSINDTRIKYIKCKENKGAPVARNIGISLAQGEYIAFQDSDDEWYPNKLKMHMEAFRMASSDTGVVYTGLYRIKNGIKVYYPKDHSSRFEVDMYAKLLNKGGIWTPAALVRKECFNIVDGFDKALSRFQDLELFIRLAKEFKFIYIDRPSYNSYHTEISITASQLSGYKSLEIILNKHQDGFRKNRKGFSLHYYNIGGWYCENDDFSKGRKYLFKSIHSYPYNIKYYTKFLLSIFGKLFYRTASKIFRKRKRLK